MKNNKKKIIIGVAVTGVIATAAIVLVKKKPKGGKTYIPVELPEDEDFVEE